MTTSQQLYPPFIVGKYKGDYLKYYGQDFLMAAAGTRSGKGTSLVIPNLLTYPDSVVVEDIKEENYLYTSGYRRACGHETYPVGAVLGRRPLARVQPPRIHPAPRGLHARGRRDDDRRAPVSVQRRREAEVLERQRPQPVHRDRAVPAGNALAAVHVWRGAAAGLRQGQGYP